MTRMKGTFITIATPFHVAVHALASPSNMSARFCSLVLDLMSIIPLIAWAVVAVISIPTYAALGWYAPVACAVYTAIICLVGGIVLWRRSHVVRSGLVYLVMKEPGIPEKPPSKTAERVQVIVASFALVVTLVWAVLSLVGMIQVISARRTLVVGNSTGIPCLGICSECPVDPYCRTWTAAVQAEKPLTSLCAPPESPAEHTNSTFSCAADFGWMLVTAAITFVWLLFVCCRKPPGPKVDPTAGGKEMQGVAQGTA